MDRDLYLLMLMQRQLEEAQGLGSDDPRLEYREEPPELKIRVRDVDTVEEMHLVGHRHDDSIESAGDQLRRLDAEGYVVLEPDESGFQAGTISITGKVLREIRQRRAFESNLPRRLMMPEVSLIGGFLVGMMSLWRADWEGHVIRVKNRLYLTSPRKAPGNGRAVGQDITEYLEIDGRLAHVGLPYLPETERPLPESMKPSQSWRSKDLYGELRAADGIHQVHAHTGLTAPFRTTGCLIAVDNVMIGDDTVKEFVT